MSRFEDKFRRKGQRDNNAVFKVKLTKRQMAAQAVTECLGKTSAHTSKCQGCELLIECRVVAKQALKRAR
jgi:hypothetical protein